MDGGALCLLTDSHCHMPTRVRELRGVVEEVADDLRHARGVGLDPDEGRFDAQVDRDAARPEELPVVLDGVAYEGGELDAVAAKLDHAARDACHVEQVLLAARAGECAGCCGSGRAGSSARARGRSGTRSSDGPPRAAPALPGCNDAG